MRIRYWSSDVCSSDLQGGGALGSYQAGVIDGLADSGIEIDWVAGISIGAINAAIAAGNPPSAREDRESVVEGKSVSVRVHIGGCRIRKQKTRHQIKYHITYVLRIV